MKKFTAILLALLMIFSFSAAAMALDDIVLAVDESQDAIQLSGVALPNVWVTVKVTDADGNICYFSSQKTALDAKYAFTMDLSDSSLPLDITLNYDDVLEQAQIKRTGSSIVIPPVDPAPTPDIPIGPSVPVIPTEPTVPEKKEVNFTDISGHWAEEAIIALAEVGIVNGRSEEIFDPSGNITRAEFLAMLMRAFGITEDEMNAAPDCGFTDIKEDAWYAVYINWGASNAVVNGMSETTFAPNELITREQMAVMAARMFEACDILPATKLPAAQFSDASEISAWAEQEVTKMQQAGILEGYPEGDFRPQANATRAEAATVILRLYQQL